MRKLLVLFLSLCIFATFTACSRNLTDKDDIISLFKKHEATFLKAGENGDYTAVERIRGVQKVHTNGDYINIEFGSSGFATSTHYYGIFYSADDDLCAVDVAGAKDELVQYGNGYQYEQSDGDNVYYVEPLGNHFFYYEAHF